MNILDLIMLLGLIAGVAIGFVRGLIQQALGLLSIYLSVTVGIWAHRLFGRAYKSLLPALSQPAANFVGFLTALLIVLNALAFLTRDIEKNARWVKKVPALFNQTGGLALGFVTSAFWLGLAGTFLYVVGNAPWVGAEEMGRTLVELADGSILTYVFRVALRLGLYTVAPWIPGGLPDILAAPF